jgi:hypothetical protein
VFYPRSVRGLDNEAQSARRETPYSVIPRPQITSPEQSYAAALRQDTQHQQPQAPQTWRTPVPQHLLQQEIQKRGLSTCEQFCRFSSLKVNPHFERICRIHRKGWRISQARNQVCLLPASCWFLAGLTLRTWRWRRHVPPKRRLTFSGLYCVLFLKTGLLLMLVSQVFLTSVLTLLSLTLLSLIVAVHMLLSTSAYFWCALRNGACGDYTVLCLCFVNCYPRVSGVLCRVLLCGRHWPFGGWTKLFFTRVPESCSSILLVF